MPAVVDDAVPGSDGSAWRLSTLEKQTRMVGAWLNAEQFAGVDLSGTVFEKARCEAATFADVDLRRADFRGAFLRGARFVGCNLAGAMFPGADLTSTRFIDCRGLEPHAVALLRARGAHVSDGRMARGEVHTPDRREE